SDRYRRQPGRGADAWHRRRHGRQREAADHHPGAHLRSGRAANRRPAWPAAAHHVQRAPHHRRDRHQGRAVERAGGHPVIRLTADNVVWWRVDVPDRDDNGELVEQPVRFRLRIFTRDELRERALARARRGATDVGAAMRRLIDSRSSEAVTASMADADAAIARMGEDEQVALEELRERVLDWNPEDVRDQNDQPVAFTSALLDALLADEARFQALRAGLLAASRGARPKN